LSLLKTVHYYSVVKISKYVVLVLETGELLYTQVEDK